jgi:hypothetical protein
MTPSPNRRGRSRIDPVSRNSGTFATEADLVAEFLRRLAVMDPSQKWKVYPESCGWDLLLVHEAGYQLGIEAKLLLNPKVIDQALVGAFITRPAWDGPDYRAVLVPSEGRQQHLANICKAIGVGVITVRPEGDGGFHWFDLPSNSEYCTWPNWGPVHRCPVPDYVPRVAAGVKSPTLLSDWKVRAIKLLIVMERKGWIDRGDLKVLGLSPTRWTCHYNGFLTRVAGKPVRYVAGPLTPDYRAQMPENFAEIEADISAWAIEHYKERPDWLGTAETEKAA